MVLSCHMALDMLCQEMRPGSGRGHREACCHGMSALLSPWTERDSKHWDVVRGNNQWKGSVAGLGGLSRPVDVLLFIFVVACTLCASLE